MRLMGSFHTITTHGRSGVTWVSSVGSSTSTGLTVGAGTAQLNQVGSRARTASHGKKETEARDPHDDGAGDVHADEQHRHPSRVLRVPDDRLGDEHDQ